MDIVKSIVVVLHLLSFAALFGVTIAQFKPASRGEGAISKGMFHCANALLVTGIALVGLTYAVGGAPNNTKIAIKGAVLLAIYAVILVNRGKRQVSAPIFGVIAALLAVNVTLAVMWH
ncbi:MAG: hypothetical protein Q4C71_00060 [Microbacteriaceae bacterium]|nr:hypothetical protein [Microbacteriaceae bacterium]